MDLGALGYLSSTESEEEASGVVEHDVSARSPGYDLITEIQRTRARLIDAHGALLRTWSSAADYVWQRAELNARGQVLVIAAAVQATTEDAGVGVEADGTQVARFLDCYDFAGERLWRRTLAVHHDLDVLPDGRLLALSERLTKPGPPFPEAGMIDNGVLLLDEQGALLEERWLHDILKQDSKRLRIPKRLREDANAKAFDFAHLNTVQWVRAEEFEAHSLWSQGVVLVTSRHLNALIAFRWEDGQVVWFFGPGTLLGPHDGKVCGDGSVLVLDNGAPDRGYSRLVRIDPLQNVVIWEWTRPTRQDFWTPAQGTVQELPNGNLLVGNSNAGEAFELGPEAREVWRYLNPERDPRTGRRGMLRLQRYAEAVVDPFLR